MSQWPSSKASRVYRALLRIGWSPKAFKGSSHVILQRAGKPDYVWPFHDNVEIGPKLLSRIAKHTGLNPKICRWHIFQETSERPVCSRVPCPGCLNST